MYLTNILYIGPCKTSKIIGLQTEDLTIKSSVATAPT